MDIKLLKLTTGEEIISFVTEGTNTVILKSPLILVMSRDSEKAQGNIIFAPWLIGSDMESEIEIRKEVVIATVAPNEQAEIAYKQALGK